MPELPEVETTRRGIEPYVRSRRIRRVRISQHQLRWPVPTDLEKQVRGQAVTAVDRRGKYLLFRLTTGTLLLHLGMSGSLRLVSADLIPGPHDHVDLMLDSGLCLRLRDPRRFGAVLWTDKDPLEHELIAPLGPEPLDDAFDGSHLWQASRRRRTSVKTLIMDGRILAGVGNIYANEALFCAGIHPARSCYRISRSRYDRLSACIKKVLRRAIDRGGTTLRDFVREDGRPGYFDQELNVYGKTSGPCPRCGGTIIQRRIGQRSSYYCPGCQH